MVKAKGFNQTKIKVNVMNKEISFKETTISGTVGNVKMSISVENEMRCLHNYLPNYMELSNTQALLGYDICEGVGAVAAIRGENYGLPDTDIIVTLVENGTKSIVNGTKLEASALTLQILIHDQVHISQITYDEANLGRLQHCIIKAAHDFSETEYNKLAKTK